MLSIARRFTGTNAPARLASEVTRTVSTSAASLKPPAPVRELEERELLALCRSKDRQAFGELYRRYRADALRYIRHAVRHSHDADDILQEVFMEVAHSLGSFEGRSSFNGWLRCICVRTAMRQMKKRYRQVGENEPEIDQKAERELHSTDDPEESYEQRERAARVRLLLEQIAPKKRMVLLLHDFEGVSPKEISQLVGAPVLTVRTRLFYARKELAALAMKDPLLSSDLPLPEGGAT